MSLQTLQIHGVALQVDEEGAGAFNVFNPDLEVATDRGPAGMVEEMAAFLRLTRDRRALLDVGALFGLFSLLFTARPDTMAYAIEPSPWAYPILEDHLRWNPAHHVVPLHRFAGDTPGRLVPCVRDWKHVIANHPPGDGETVNLAEVRLDDMDLEPIDCMKVDVEAYECAVLRGAQNLLRRDRPLIFLEVHGATLPHNGESTASLMQILEGLEYAVEDYHGAPIEDLLAWSDSITRVLCRPREKVRR